MSLARYRIYLVNAFIGALLIAMAIDALPAPLGVQLRLRPVLTRLGIGQGAWSMFAPDPDRRNLRLRAEITYRDGQQRQWTSPDWQTATPWTMFVGHRRREWLDQAPDLESSPAWPSWCRFLARTHRPELAHADQGATVRIIYHEALVPREENKPWKSVREPPVYDEGWILTTEKLD